MDALPVNIADILVGLIILISALLAFVRGFFREVLAITAWVGAFFVALYGFSHTQPYVSQIIGNETIADIANGIGLFVIAVIFFSIISHLVASGLKGSGLGAVDRSLGFVFGMVRGAVIVSALHLMMLWAIDNQEPPKWIGQARSLPLIAQGSSFLLTLLPENILSDVDRAAAKSKALAGQEFKKQALEHLTSPPPKGTSTNSGDSDQGTGYTDAQRKQMNDAIKGSQ
jgi:membrane protein required for colicin V production|tara:strand:- start:365 stop:1048 length:684 start_codon:yes stop_codon:yes gene_type:complete